MCSVGTRYAVLAPYSGLPHAIIFSHSELLNLTPPLEGARPVSRLSRTSLGMVGRPEHISKLAVYLGSDESSYMTGQVIVIDGGRVDNLTHSV